MTNRFINEFIAARNGEREFPEVPFDEEEIKEWNQAQQWSLVDALVRQYRFRIFSDEISFLAETEESDQDLRSGRPIVHTMGELYHAVFSSGNWVFNISKIEWPFHTVIMD